eukprot:3480558-Amphidinium_carterae.1
MALRQDAGHVNTTFKSWWMAIEAHKSNRRRTCKEMKLQWSACDYKFSCAFGFWGGRWGEVGTHKS